MGKVLIFIGTPKQAHYYSHIVKALKSEGIDVILVARPKECTLDLMNHYFDEYDIVYFSDSIINKAFGMFAVNKELYKIAKANSLSAMISTLNPSVSQMGKFLDIPTITINDTDHAKILASLCIPFSDIVLTNATYLHDYGHKHIRYDGFLELIYLDRTHFIPNKDTINRLKSDNDQKLIVLRFIKSAASHDLESGGFSLAIKIKLVEYLSQYGQIMISSESELPPEIEKYRFKMEPHELHSCLYYSDLCVSDGSSTAVEAALLGTPSIHYEKLNYRGNMSKITSHLGYLKYLSEKRMFNTYNNKSDVLLNSLKFIRNPNSKRRAIERSDKFFRDNRSPLKFIIDTVQRAIK